MWPDKKEDMITCLWDLVVHPATKVRCSVLQLFNVLINVASSQQISKRILPALITLSNDIDKMVRFHGVAPLGSVAMNAAEDEILEKVKTQFEMILDDSSHAILQQVVHTFSSIIPHVKASFRDQYILPKLQFIVKGILTTNNAVHKGELARASIDAYRACDSCMDINVKTISDYILPGLEILSTAAASLDASYQTMVSTMMKDMQNRLLGSKQEQDAKDENDPDQSLGAKLSRSSTNQMLDEAKNSFLKMFNFQEGSN